MAEQTDDGFELVLSNRQLLSLFFVVVVFFAGFFSVGYFVGHGHAQGIRPTPELAEAPQPAPSRAEVPLPTVLEQQAAAEPTPASVVTPREEPLAPTPARTSSAPPPPVAPPITAPAEPVAAPRAAPIPRPATTTTDAYNVQVSAVRVAGDAAILSGRLRERGYPVHVAAGSGDGWHRIMVGPFASREAAQESEARLKADGFETVLKAP